MWKQLAANAFTVFTVALVALAIAVAWAQNEYRREGPLEAAICLGVGGGRTMLDVSRDLAEQGAISSDTIFRVGADYQRKSGQLKAGKYLIEPGMAMDDIVALITTSAPPSCGFDVNFRIGISRIEVDVREMDPATGRFETRANYLPASQEPPEAYHEALDDVGLRLRVTLAEGVTSWQVVEGLKLVGFLSGEAGAVPAEGSLAPDSYQVTEGAGRGELIARMEQAQATILAAAWIARAEGLPLASPEDVLILASIIEKETAVAEERRTISQVFINRLEQRIRLQTDPTVIYGITKGQGTLGHGLRRSELDRKTPWNTYQIDGLPETPIANPGRAAIEAAVNPDGSDYIFFVADGSGGHAFAATLSEHNANVAKWRAIEAERSDN